MGEGHLLGVIQREMLGDQEDPALLRQAGHLSVLAGVYILGLYCRIFQISKCSWGSEDSWEISKHGSVSRQLRC